MARRISLLLLAAAAVVAALDLAIPALAGG